MRHGPRSCDTLPGSRGAYMYLAYTIGDYLCLCPCAECSMRLHLALDRSSIFSEQTSPYTFSPLWGTTNGIPPSGLLDYSASDSQWRSSGEDEGSRGCGSFSLGS